MPGQVQRNGPGQVVALARRASSFVGQGGAASRLPHCRTRVPQGLVVETGKLGTQHRQTIIAQHVLRHCHDRLDGIWAGGRGGHEDDDMSLW